jgi:hypothetical protein
MPKGPPERPFFLAENPRPAPACEELKHIPAISNASAALQEAAGDAASRQQLLSGVNQALISSQKCAGNPRTGRRLAASGLPPG